MLFGLGDTSLEWGLGAPLVFEALAMAHYGPICVYKHVWVLFGLGDTSLEWGLGARLLSLRP